MGLEKSTRKISHVYFCALRILVCMQRGRRAPGGLFSVGRSPSVLAHVVLGSFGVTAIHGDDVFKIYLFFRLPPAELSTATATSRRAFSGIIA